MTYRTALATTCLLLVAAPVFAQRLVQELRAELSSGFGVAQGRLILAGDRLVFIDDSQPDSSFIIDRRDVQELVPDSSGGVSLQLATPIRDRGGERTRVTFRLGETATLNDWFARTASATSTRTRTGDATSPGTYAARRDKMFGGSQGRLIVREDRLVYEATDNAGDSREWMFSSIREIKQKNPYEIEIKPFNGDDYKLKLESQGMATDEFARIVDKVTQARARR